VVAGFKRHHCGEAACALDLGKSIDLGVGCTRTAVPSFRHNRTRIVNKDTTDLRVLSGAWATFSEFACAVHRVIIGTDGH
jgi:hypothetical protein